MVSFALYWVSKGRFRTCLQNQLLGSTAQVMLLVRYYDIVIGYIIGPIFRYSIAAGRTHHVCGQLIYRANVTRCSPPPQVGHFDIERRQSLFIETGQPVYTRCASRLVDRLYLCVTDPGLVLVSSCGYELVASRLPCFVWNLIFWIIVLL